MARIRSAAPGGAVSQDYLQALREQIGALLPHRGLSLIDPVRRWSDRLLVICAVLLCWAPGTALVDRFTLARSSLIKLYSSRQRPGESYCGFMDSLTRHSARLLAIVIDALRRRQSERGGWKTFGFVVFGVDGTKIKVPRTDRNIEAFGVANKKHAGPEMLLTCLFHLATRTLWSFRHDRAAGSERGLLAQMIPDLPGDSLVVADAGFVGYDVIQTLLDAGIAFVIRAGANVRLITDLGYAQEYEGIVHLWPSKQQKKNMPPIVLRRLLVQDAKGREMCLLTSVLDKERLSDAALKTLYAQRWGVEIAYRWLKQTMQGRKMLSTSPAHARVELNWTMIGLWMLTQMALQENPAPTNLSVAEALRIVRDVMTHRHRGRRRQSLRYLLRRARTDRYQRRRPKSKRHWPTRARVHRCRIPLARMATPAEITRIQTFLAAAL